MIGRTIAGRFEVKTTLGEGGFGAVYVAVQQPVGRRVALKVMRPALANQADTRARFFREAQAVAQLSHPNCVVLFDYGEDDGALFMALELVDGAPLNALLAETRRLSPGRAVALAAQMLSALAAAHDLGIVHRDVKPHNVMVFTDSDGVERIKMLDFGVAKIIAEGEAETLTGEGALVGTPAYMAPEQTTGGAIDARTDVYAAGVVLYEMLAGRRPFRGVGVNAAVAHLSAPVPPLPDDLPLALTEVVLKALAKQPADRFPDARSFAGALLALDLVDDALADSLNLDPNAETLDGPLEPTADVSVAQPPRRLPWLILAVALVAAAVTWFATRPSPEPVAAVPDATTLAALAPDAAPPPPDASAPDISVDAAPMDARAPDATVKRARPRPPRVVVAPPSKVRLRSVPSGAQVIVGGKVIGRTPLAVPQGTRARVELLGYESQTVNVGAKPRRVELRPALDP